MPETFYHVDRWDDLSACRTVSLAAFESDDAAAAETVAEFYPAGLSRHGRHYCDEDLYGDDPDDVWDVACEVVFEVARLARFPERPSRFQSVFAFRTLEDVERFVDELVDSSYTVWAVETDGRTNGEAEGAFAGDMNLVDAENLADGLRRADCYWRGETFLDDPLWEVLLTPPIRVVEAVERGDPG